MVSENVYLLCEMLVRTFCQQSLNLDMSQVETSNPSSCIKIRSAMTVRKIMVNVDNVVKAVFGY